MDSGVPSGRATRPFAGYELLARVAKHGGTSTFKAVQKTLGRTVLVTILPADCGKQPHHREHFQRQVAITSRLRHENVISAIDAGTWKGCRYFVTEFVEGHTLADELERHGAMPLARALAIARDVARALSHMEAEKLVHRNIAPQAILLTDAGQTKLAGFAIAKDQRPGGHETWIDHDLGNALYLSPESLRGERGIDVRADVYSLGCVLYHMLTGHAPFAAKTPAVVLESHVLRVPTDPREVRKGIPHDVVQIVDRCLRKRREHRYAKAEDLAKDLEAARTNRPLAKCSADGALWTAVPLAPLPIPLPRLGRRK
jgi:eukaryotic-like serine/threonine-protein kinase